MPGATDWEALLRHFQAPISFRGASLACAVVFRSQIFKVFLICNFTIFSAFNKDIFANYYSCRIYKFETICTNSVHTVERPCALSHVRHVALYYNITGRLRRTRIALVKTKLVKCSYHFDILSLITFAVFLKISTENVTFFVFKML